MDSIAINTENKAKISKEVEASYKNLIADIEKGNITDMDTLLDRMDEIRESFAYCYFGTMH